MPHSFLVHLAQNFDILVLLSSWCWLLYDRSLDRLYFLLMGFRNLRFDRFNLLLGALGQGIHKLLTECDVLAEALDLFHQVLVGHGLPK